MKKRKITLLVGVLIALAVITAACGGKAGSSPTATAKAFYEAARSKDISGMKSLVSKNTLDMLDKAAKAQNKTVDDLLKASNESAPPPATFETRNEKIDGDKATLEVNQDGKGKWQTVTFVKEDGSWKLDH
jgi:ABC-type glycerol-3-phosphate transport system substrate-binding protein